VNSNGFGRQGEALRTGMATERVNLMAGIGYHHAFRQHKFP